MRAAAVACSFALLLACSKPAREPAPPEALVEPARAKVRLQLNWFPEPEFGGFYAARERGLFAKRNADVEILQGGADVPAPQLLASGRVEMAVLAAEQVLTLRASGGRVKAVFATFQVAPRCIVVKADSPHATLPDLWGAEATVLAQDGLTFIKWLNRVHGGSRLTFVPYAGSSAPLVAGAADAMQGFATSEPLQLEIDGTPVRTFLVAESGLNPYDVVLCVNEDFLAAHEDVVLDVLDGVREGWRSYLDDPAPINAVMAGLNRDMRPEVMARSAAILPSFVESDATRTHGLGWMELERWQQLAGQLRDVGDLAADADPSAAFANLSRTPAPAP